MRTKNNNSDPKIQFREPEVRDHFRWCFLLGPNILRDTGAKKPELFMSKGDFVRFKCEKKNNNSDPKKQFRKPDVRDHLRWCFLLGPNILRDTGAKKLELFMSKCDFVRSKCEKRTIIQTTQKPFREPEVRDTFVFFYARPQHSKRYWSEKTGTFYFKR